MWNVSGSHEFAALGAIQLLWVRVNPDTTFVIGDKKHVPSKPSPEQRCAAVASFIGGLKSDAFEDDPSRIHVCYAFYQMHADCTAKVADDPSYAKELRPHVRALEHTVVNGVATLRVVQDFSVGRRVAQRLV